MTAFARKVLTELPSPTNAQSGNNYVVLQQFENVSDKFGSKVDVTFAPGLTAFARYGYRDVDIEDQPPIPLPSGGDGNGQTYVTNKQLAGGATTRRRTTPGFWDGTHSRPVTNSSTFKPRCRT
jgi:hypothetical protein